MSPIPLTSLARAGRQQNRLSYPNLFLTRQFYTSQDRLLASSTPISHRLGPMSLLFGNSVFPPALGFDFLIWRNGDQMSQTLFVARKLLSYDALQGSCPGDHLFWLSYYQLQSFLTNSEVRDSLAQEKTPFEEYPLIASQPSHVLSSTYAFLRNSLEASSLPFVRDWESELGTFFSEQDWHKSFILTHKLPVACVAQQKNYKILTRWYRYPALLHRMYSSTSDCCWRCISGRPPHHRLWWNGHLR